EKWRSRTRYYCGNFWDEDCCLVQSVAFKRYRTVVRDGKYTFGALVGALEENFAIGAHKSAKKSEGGDEVIIT
ncbi:1915_t:CDS:2, partial [Dentiscutata erythropus]